MKVLVVYKPEGNSWPARSLIEERNGLGSGKVLENSSDRFAYYVGESPAYLVSVLLNLKKEPFVKAAIDI